MGGTISKVRTKAVDSVINNTLRLQCSRKYQFYRAACWVFGFAGIRDHDQVRAVASAFEDFGAEVFQGQHSNMAPQLSRASNRMAQLLEIIRQETPYRPAIVDGVTIPIRVYGAFQGVADNGHVTPDHAWFVVEANNTVYETFPNLALQWEPATPQSIHQPGSIQDEAHILGHTYAVGETRSVMSAAQLQNIIDHDETFLDSIAGYIQLNSPD